MKYKIFLVEDEISTREGIRDHMDWEALGYEFCGEAPDGEIALPLIQQIKPDVIITDIKMPFMGGLELIQLVRETLPGCKIIILSGHDEFQYAQQAIRLGVTEYLLKPISTPVFEEILTKISNQLDSERQEQRYWQSMVAQVQEQLLIQREKFLIRLISGGLNLPDAIEQSNELDLKLLAKWYQVLVIQAEADCSLTSPLKYGDYQQTAELIDGLTQNVDGVISFRKDVEEVVLIVTGDSDERLYERTLMLAQMIKEEVHSKTPCILQISIGSTCERLTAIPESYQQALHDPQPNQTIETKDNDEVNLIRIAWQQIDRTAVERYLKFGVKKEFDDFYRQYVQPLHNQSQDDQIFLNYVLIDMVLSAVDFVVDLGGILEEDLPEARWIKPLLANIQSPDQLKAKVREIIFTTLDFRDRHAAAQSKIILQHAREFIDNNYADPDISLSVVAGKVNISPGHFSTIFKKEIGENFIEYLTRLRIEKAKELLRTTNYRATEIADMVGYHDSHYFSTVFKKQTGLPPTKYRSQAFRS